MGATFSTRSRLCPRPCPRLCRCLPSEHDSPESAVNIYFSSRGLSSFFFLYFYTFAGRRISESCVARERAGPVSGTVNICAASRADEPSEKLRSARRDTREKGSSSLACYVTTDERMCFQSVPKSIHSKTCANGGDSIVIWVVSVCLAVFANSGRY